MRVHWVKVYVIFLLGLLSLENSFAQSSYLKVQISEEGVYKIDSETLSDFGFTNLENIAFFGYPGSLPQLISENSLELQEIPTQLKNGELFVFLSGAHSFQWKEEFEYSHHIYRDTLSYLIGIKEKPLRVNPKESVASSQENTLVYEWSAVKGEEINILNSGRNWYSSPIYSGSLRSIPFRKSSDISAPWKIFGTLMGQSINESSIRLLENGNEIFQSTIPAIPNSSYGLKGEVIRFASDFSSSQNSIQTIELSYTSSDPNGNGYYDFIALGVPTSTENLDQGIYFNLSESPVLTNSSDLEYWNVTDFFQPEAFDFSIEKGITGKKIVAFNPDQALSFENISEVSLELREQSSWPELLIISPELFISEAEKLRVHKLTQGIQADVIKLQEIYDAFGYGNRDVVAIRNFLAWHFQKGKTLKNVLMLGKGTFDHKNKLGGRPNLIPIYTSRISLNPLTTYSSDDFYGLLEIGQGNWEESKEGDEFLQIGIGRLPVITVQEAALVVNKIISYESNPLLGDWKKNLTWMADDGDSNIHLRDSEKLSDYLSSTYPEFDQNKIYLDQFPQVSNGNSQSSPEAKSELLTTLKEGTLFINYIGHGNETTLTEEEIFRVEDIPNWPEFDQLALWITATCEFGRHDSPFLRSAAEELLIAKNKGAIGLLTTGRPVFSSVNFTLNQAFIQSVLQSENGQYQDLGTIFKKTKNNSLNGALNRNFSLLGDPSMRLSRPEFKIQLSSFKDKDGNELETIPALEEVYFEGQIINSSMSLESGFEGEYTLEIKVPNQSQKTLGDESSPIEYSLEKDNLVRMKGEVINGKFQGILKIPGIDEEVQTGNFKLFASDPRTNQEALGEEEIQLGRISGQNPIDTEGPIIEVNVNEKKAPWVFPSRSVSILINLTDSSGIDISGIDPEKNLQITINGAKTIILNAKFSNLDGDFRQGEVLLNIDDLNEGINFLKIQATDLAGNQSIFQFEIQVEGSTQIQILNHIVYPNPASVSSQFEIKHNRPNETLNLSIEIINLNGQILNNDSYRLVEANEIITDLVWIFLQNQTKYPAKGTYIYKLTLHSEKDGTSDSASGKIVIE